MTNTSPTSKLAPENAAILLVDHQVGLIVGSRYPDPETLRRNALGLVRAARALEVPIIATTTLEGLFGPVFPELAEALGRAGIIERTKIDPFDDARIAEAIATSGRTHVITAGVFISVCAALPAISATERGYRSYVALDASAAIDAVERDTAILRMSNAGVTVTVYGALMVEMLADNADPRARAVYQAIGTQYGVPTLASMRSPVAA